MRYVINNVLLVGVPFLRILLAASLLSVPCAVAEPRLFTPLHPTNIIAQGQPYTLHRLYDIIHCKNIEIYRGKEMAVGLIVVGHRRRRLRRIAAPYSGGCRRRMSHPHLMPPTT